MASSEEEWALKFLVTGAGDALKLASNLGALDSKQIAAAQSAKAVQAALASLKSTEESGNVAQRAAAKASLERLQIADAMRGAKAREAADAKALRDAGKADSDAARARNDAMKAASASAKARDADAAKQAKANWKLRQDAEKDAANASKRAAATQASAAKAGAAAQAEGAAAVTDSLNGLKDPLGSVAGMLTKLGPEGAAAAAALLAIVGAATLAAVALYKLFDIATQLIAQRNQLLATFGALSGGGAGGGKTLAIVEKLGTVLPFATSKIAEWATGLQKANFQGKALEKAIKGVAAAETLIAGGGAAAEGLFKTLGMGGAAALQLVASLKMGGPEARAQLAEMGLRVEDIAQALGMTTAQFKTARLSAKQMAEAVQKALATKAAGPLADLMLTFPVLVGRVKEGFLSLFDKLGPAVRPFMRAVKELFDKFSKGGSVIAALKPIVTSVMSTLFGWATRAVGALSWFVSAFMKAGKAGGVLSGVVGVLKAAWSGLAAVFGLVMAELAPFMPAIKRFLTSAAFLNQVKNAFTAIAIVIGVVGGAVLILAAIMIAPLVMIAGVLIGVGVAIGALVDVAVDAASSIGGAFSGLGSMIVSGLVGGLDFGAFASKMAGLAQAGLTAFKGAFGMASPSKVMKKAGEKDIAGAAATGVDKGVDKFDASMAKLGPPEEGEGGGKGGKGKKGETRHYHFHYAGPADDADTFFEKAAQWVKGLALEASEPAGTVAP